MCIGGSPAKPTPPPLPAAPPPPPTPADPAVIQARRKNKARSLVSDRGGAIATSQQGDLSFANKEKKSLLGA